MYTIKFTKQFVRDWKRCERQGLPMDELQKAIDLLSQNGHLPANYRPHKLSGNRAGEWECHIKPDWLLIWEQYEEELTLLLLNTGTHSELFKK